MATGRRGQCPIRGLLLRAIALRGARAWGRERLTRPMLARVFSQLTLSPELMEKLGPAANCAASVLLYGPPGNGKSSIATAICAEMEVECTFVQQEWDGMIHAWPLFAPRLEEGRWAIAQGAAFLRRLVEA